MKCHRFGDDAGRVSIQILLSLSAQTPEARGVEAVLGLLSLWRTCVGSATSVSEVAAGGTVLRPVQLGSTLRLLPRDVRSASWHPSGSWNIPSWKGPIRIIVDPIRIIGDSPYDRLGVGHPLMILLDILVWFFLALAGAWTLSSAVPCRDGSGESFSMPSFSPGMCFWWDNSHPAETNGCQLLLGLCLALLSPQKDFPIETFLLPAPFPQVLSCFHSSGL